MSRVEASVSVASITPFTRALMEMSEPVRQLALNTARAVLAEAGLGPDDLIDPEVRISFSVCTKLSETVAEVAACPDFALRAALAARRGDLGIYEYVTATCATLRESIEATCRYQPLLYDAAEVQLLEEGDQATLRYRVADGYQAPIGHVEFALAGFARAAHRLLGTDAPPLEARFTHAAPSHLDAYDRVFGCRLRFEAAHNELVFPRARLAKALRTSDPKLHLILRRYADRMLDALPTLQPTSRAVRNILRQRMEEGPLKLREIPEALHMSERSLRRHLAAEGTSLQAMVEESRKELARQYLATSRLTVSEIAYRLGFANPPSFHRAFQRWFSISPLRYRRDHATSPAYHFLNRDPS